MRFQFQIATSLSAGAKGFSVDEIRRVSDRLKKVIKNLASLQCQITPVAQGAMQNQRAMDLLTADKGGNCVFMGEKGCYYGNESGLVETDSNHFTSCRKNSTNTTRHLSILFLLAVCTLHMGSPVLRAGNFFFSSSKHLAFFAFSRNGFSKFLPKSQSNASALTPPIEQRGKAHHLNSLPSPQCCPPATGSSRM